MIRTSQSNVRLLRQAMTPRHGVSRMKGTISREPQRARRSYLSALGSRRRRLKEFLSSKSGIIFCSLQEAVSNSNGKRARENLHAPSVPELEYPHPKGVLVAKQFGTEVVASVNASQGQLPPEYLRTWEFRLSFQAEVVSQVSTSAEVYKKRQTSSEKDSGVDKK
ncbi:hypothetical protein PNOK_0734300 [Pyrrhoderma noxium]|uniref:Uncharacterized protein n=1 Tax=Pyrrhoderma noxium TaxID=2282107 RepID=A0A286UCM0_9AGAM|nr:hypothetical protein PNOK_0734300 [Pyrrhoderma noxium]